MNTAVFQPFDAVRWLNQFLPLDEGNSEMVREDLEDVLSFTLMWSAFENLICGRRASISKIESAVNENLNAGRLTGQQFNQFLLYAQTRYVNEGRTNERFEQLHFRTEDRKELVRQVLLGELNDPNNIILSLLIIIYRYRNNLFHGEKAIRKLNFQSANLRFANRVLATFLEATVEVTQPPF